MYAIIESGGKQYRIAEGTKLRIEKSPGNADDQVLLDHVLAVNDGERMLVGTPYVPGAHATGRITAQGRAKKVVIFRYKRRKDTKKKRSCRQEYTELVIEKIEVEAAHGA
jgi:large subunit ribosomal protein L21